MKVLETERLILRTFEDKDIDPNFKMNQDPRVLEFLRGPMSLKEVEAFQLEMNKQFETKGFAFWAAEEKETQSFVGWIGLNYPKWDAHFTPCVDIGWRLAFEHWGKGYATEGAKAALHYGFTVCHAKEIVSFTVPANVRSRHVMDKLGMTNDPKDDFLQPLLPPDHKCSKCVLYRKKNPQCE